MVGRTPADPVDMPTHEELPAWEKRGERPPWESAEAAARERLREQRRLAHVRKLAEDDRRRARKSTPLPPPSGR